VAVIFMLAILMISLSVAAPAIKREIQRDREVETMQRGKQYIRAIKMYYKKFGAYPANVDALVKTNEIRFLRRKYVDPTTGKEEWKAIHLGENKAPTAMGFFGQPLAGSSSAGIGPGVTGATTLGGDPSSTNGSSSIFGASNSGTTTGTGTSSTTSGTGSTDSSSSSSSSTGLSGQTFGGGGIIGFSPGSPKQSILVYKKKSHYNEWEFVYDPLADRMMMGGSSAPSGAQSAGSISSGIGGSPTTSPTSPTSPTTTPQP